MRDGPPPRGARGPYGPRGGDDMPRRRYDGTPPPPSRPPYRDPAPNARPDNPYRPFGEPASSHLPAPYQRGTLGTFSRLPASGQGFAPPDEPEDSEPHHHRLGFAIFHDGNPGHLWRGSVASVLGEGLLSAGMLIWLTALTLSPLVVALAIVSFGLPFLLAGPFAASLESSAEPEAILRWVGRLRIVLVLALVAMHFKTILPVVYLLLFAISLCGRLHDALRTAVIRTCLRRGEPEQVANDLHVGSALAAVLGPLLATFCYIILGERVILVALGAAAFFLISVNAEGFLDTLPPSRRDFLLATPESATSGEDWPDAIPLDDDQALHLDDLDPEEQREHALPAWYQLGPSNAFGAIGEIRAGLGLAGTTQSNATALWALAALSFIGGGLALLEVFYLLQNLGLSPFYLGPLLAAEGAGLAFGALLGGSSEIGGPWRGRFLVGLVGSGAALAALARFPSLPLVIAACFALGACNALTVQAARQGLLEGLDGIERRAVTAAETFVVALCAVLGTLVFTALFDGAELPIHVPASLTGWSASGLIFSAGVGLIAAAVVFALLLSIRPKGAAAHPALADSSTGVRLPALDDEDVADDEDYPPATGEHDAWDESDARDDYADSYGYRGTGYGPAAKPARGAAYDDNDYEDTGNDYDDEYDDPPSRRRGSPARRPPRDNRRPRW